MLENSPSAAELADISTTLAGFTSPVNTSATPEDKEADKAAQEAAKRLAANKEFLEKYARDLRDGNYKDNKGKVMTAEEANDIIKYLDKNPEMLTKLREQAKDAESAKVATQALSIAARIAGARDSATIAGLIAELQALPTGTSVQDLVQGLIAQGTSQLHVAESFEQSLKNAADSVVSFVGSAVQTVKGLFTSDTMTHADHTFHNTLDEQNKIYHSMIHNQGTNAEGKTTSIQLLEEDDVTKSGRSEWAKYSQSLIDAQNMKEGVRSLIEFRNGLSSGLPNANEIIAGNEQLMQDAEKKIDAVVAARYRLASSTGTSDERAAREAFNAARKDLRVFLQVDVSRSVRGESRDNVSRGTNVTTTPTTSGMAYTTPTGQPGQMMS